jgi:membrane protease YdiL (CAAX protease family)
MRLPDHQPALPILIIPLLIVISQFDKLQVSYPPQILIFACLAAMTGLAEETVFRGIAFVGPLFYSGSIWPLVLVHTT